MAFATVVSPGLHACTQIDRGAVEVSWSLYSETGVPMSKCGKVGSIVLHWDVITADGHSEGRTTVFPCDDDHGVTGFDLPPGQASLWLSPACSSGAAVGPFDAPAPIVRAITAGDVVTLDAQLIQVSGATCP